MLLKDWIYKFHEKIYKGDLVWRTYAKDLHVVGTCGDCKHWVQEDGVGWGSCGNPQKDGELGTVGHTFGCIHFEGKTND